MSDVSQGPGWWIASDGRWYPPQEHPDRTGAGATGAGVPGASSSGEASGEAPSASAVGPPFTTAGEGQVVDPQVPVRQARSTRLWILGAVVLVALAAAALIVALRSPAPTGSALSPGPTTASIVVTLPTTGTPSFSGTLAGRPLTGVITGKGVSTTEGPIAEYKGTLGSEPFDLHVSIRPFQGGQILFGVTGTYGSQPVTATARFGIGSSTARSLSVPFNGRVGSQAIDGVAIATTNSGRGVQIRATLSVLSSSI